MVKAFVKDHSMIIILCGNKVIDYDQENSNVFHTQSHT
jgi:hypothetical protein